jgi:hypothetical protein
MLSAKSSSNKQRFGSPNVNPSCSAARRALYSGVIDRLPLLVQPPGVRSGERCADETLLAPE